MSFSFLARLLCCCSGPRTPAHDVESTGQVIPNETTRLLDPPSSPAPIAVDHQKLSDKLGSIVRAKEGKMVSVSARAPFMIHSAHDSEEENLPSTSHMAPTHTANNATISRRPPVLTMTPARSQGSLNLYSDSRSQLSSPAGSRSSSRRRPELRSNSVQSHSSNSAPVSARGKSVGWLAESSSERSVEEEPPSLIPIANPPAAGPSDPHAITFSWD
ncbi:hypothetical protein B0H17DRAFT_1094609 [Mycena rosella]|uniref:Uncharacterized protein n=1 Tax=Mycena rosella TaxID=1033263 RepID=A0AAD7CSP3_MYCRO|nr:hypothetical protein B0H17DRAFT_1094609 [Mycena rosella]